MGIASNYVLMTTRERGDRDADVTKEGRQQALSIAQGREADRHTDIKTDRKR